MIVVAELDAGLFASLAGAIEEVSGAPPATGLDALLFVDPGANDVAVADDLRGLQSFRPFFLANVVAHVAGRRGQAILVEGCADVLRRMIEVAGEFDFLVPGGSDFRDGAFEVGFHGVAHGVELEADAVNVMCVRSPGRLGGGCESCCDGSADKCASIHGRHFTPSGRKGNRDSAKKRCRRSYNTNGWRLPGAAGLFDGFRDGQDEFVFKWPADDLDTDGQSFVRNACRDGRAGKAGQVQPLRKPHGVAVARAGEIISLAVTKRGTRGNR